MWSGYSNSGLNCGEADPTKPAASQVERNQMEDHESDETSSDDDSMVQEEGVPRHGFSSGDETSKPLLIANISDNEEQREPSKIHLTSSNNPLICNSQNDQLSIYPLDREIKIEPLSDTSETEPENQILRDTEFSTPEFSGLVAGAQNRPVDQILPNFEGPCKFGVIFPAVENSRSPGFYVSHGLNKVFLRMGSAITLKFTLDPTQAPSSDLFVRATLKFVDMDVMQYPVDRCTIHMLEDDPLNKAHEFEHLCQCSFHNLAGHVLRSSTPDAIYWYDARSKRHSVFNPLKGRSHDVTYSLHCKSACFTGINRRPMQIVFTLEIMNGMILGQTSLNIHVSANPKRDRDRSEFRDGAFKRRRVIYERTEPPKPVTLTATSGRNESNPTVTSSDLNDEDQKAPSKRHLLEAVEYVKQQLAAANDGIQQLLDLLNNCQ